MRIQTTVLLRWQQLDAAVVLSAIADHAKKDRTFTPTKSRESSRWHASVGSREFELLLTGPKFWDTRARQGGGGAVDLVMHLARMDFRQASQWLHEHHL